MEKTHEKIARAHGLLCDALDLLDEREFLVEAAFVQTALDRLSETIETTLQGLRPNPPAIEASDKH